MINTAWIFLGAGLGGVMRYWVSLGVYRILGKAFPYGTLVVNVTGCLLMGIIYSLTLERLAINGASLRAFILIGLLGGYTTFSSFSIETINLIENGKWLSALTNVLLSVILCLMAAWIGVIQGRKL